jgi:hypothetical protein
MSSLGGNQNVTAVDPYAAAGAQMQVNQQMYDQLAAYNRVNQVGPYTGVYWGKDANGNWIQSTQWNPDYKAAQDAQLGAQTLGGQAAQAAGQQVLGMLGGGSWNPQIGQFVLNQNIPSMVDQLNPNYTQTGLDLSSEVGIPGAKDLTAGRDQVVNALYGQATSRLDPQWQKQQDAFETKLANQGITATSNPTAYSAAMQEFGKQRTDAYNTAMNSAIGAGGAEQTRQIQSALDIRNQQLGQALQQGQFYNQGMAQNWQQRLQAGQFTNAARAQRYGELSDQEKQTFAEQQAIRNQSLNEYNLLMGRASGMPSGALPSYSSGSAGSTPDMGGLMNQNYQQQLAQQNASNAGLGGMLQGGMSMLPFLL